MEDVAEVLPARRVRPLGIALMAAIVCAAGVAVYRDRHSFASALGRVGAGALIVSFGIGVVGMATLCPLWRSVLSGLDVDIPRRPAARVYYPTQLGKYLPGAVWPVLLQTEAGRRYGAARRTMVTAGALTLVIQCATGLLLACVLLPFSDAGALSRYWFVIPAVPALLAMLHPRAMPLAVDRAMMLLRRPPLGARLDPAAELRACGWALVSWLGLGGQVAVLCAAVGKGGLSTVVLCVGAMGFAVSLGVLFIPAPAGAGVREVVLVLTLGTVLRPGTALAVAVASRALLVAADVTLAMASVALLRRPGSLTRAQPVAYDPPPG